MAFSKEEVQRWSEQFETQSAEAVLAWALERFHPRIALANSLQTEDMVVLDIAWRIQPQVRVFTLDTGRLHQETYDMIDRVRDHYGIRLEVLFPEAAEVEAMVRAKGLNLFYESVENRHECCGVRKVNPLRKLLAGLDGWVTGLRRDQWASRANVPKVEIDAGNGGILKLNPIAEWTQEQLDKYIQENKVPQHALYSKGFTSIGCLPCTRQTKPGENPRAGRWWWEQDLQKECGLHVAPVAK
ncbi:MAG: phosphoadenosine phosphosulfate reductase [Acidobacteria bacterium RIFCSPLOWO2_12_FULL_59_11]|nr:MAG: phosphoadenosine phosphosulfate reductase [Acidobacteria bacterium RIFCSPLOWO2_12_FULL_59_11]